MRCYECGGRYIAKHGSLELVDKYIGPFIVEEAEYFECDKCGDYLFSPETSKRIESARGLVFEEKLQSLPIRDFVTAVEAATILGISRQALHKHRRIRRGFIFQTQLSDKTVYLKKSVDLFKETGDGRFQLIVTDRKTRYSTDVSDGAYGDDLVDSFFVPDKGHFSTTTSFASATTGMIPTRKPRRLKIVRPTADSEMVSMRPRARWRDAA